MIVNYIVLVIASYLIGAIPWGFIVGKAQGIDVRKHGSGKTGATNTLRTLGTRSSALVFLCDAGKGVAVVLLARYFFNSPTAEVFAAVAAVIGHNWSVYIRFFGGRGVSISMGSILAMYLPVTILGVFIFAAIIIVTRYVSLASIIGIACTALALVILFLLRLDLPWFGTVPVEYVAYSLIGGPLVIFAHWDNIIRLRSGKERKLGGQLEAKGN
ncbi:MAG: glycerol-3-phosphate 1-O-acyltransferase PlsY [Dehalococcoidia bacterium]|nr:glycerol-3-phosphate 1-O-acyltransferase PlsY [Dehalococcoidia bacterium]